MVKFKSQAMLMSTVLWGRQARHAETHMGLSVRTSHWHKQSAGVLVQITQYRQITCRADAANACALIALSFKPGFRRADRNRSQQLSAPSRSKNIELPNLMTYHWRNSCVKCLARPWHERMQTAAGNSQIAEVVLPLLATTRLNMSARPRS